ncbi:hypothetical protein BH20BAC1_BH20BAC1_14140 [soil metagenome]
MLPIWEREQKIFFKRGFVKFTSHKLIVLHPSFFKALITFLSLAILRLFYPATIPALVFGTTKYLQPSCPCQKQACTNITVLYFGKTPPDRRGRQYQACGGGFYGGANYKFAFTISRSSAVSKGFLRKPCALLSLV